MGGLDHLIHAVFTRIKVRASSVVHALSSTTVNSFLASARRPPSIMKGSLASAAPAALDHAKIFGLGATAALDHARIFGTVFFQATPIGALLFDYGIVFLRTLTRDLTPWVPPLTPLLPRIRRGEVGRRLGCSHAPGRGRLRLPGTLSEPPPPFLGGGSLLELSRSGSGALCPFHRVPLRQWQSADGGRHLIADRLVPVPALPLHRIHESPCQASGCGLAVGCARASAPTPRCGSGRSGSRCGGGR